MIKIILLTSLLILPIYAQEGYWEAITPIKKVDKLILHDNTVYGASKGGILKMNSDFSIEYFTKGDGPGGVITPDITENDLGVLSINLSNQLNIYDGENWTTGEPIPLNEWMKIDATDETAWVSYRTGVIVFEFYDNKWQYRDFFNQFPATLSGNIQPVVFNNRIYLFSDGSAVSAPADFHTHNLKNIENWRIVSFWSPTDVLYSYSLNNDRLYLAGNSGLREIDQAENITVLPALPGGSTVGSLFTDNGEFYAMGGINISSWENNNWVSKATLDKTYKSFVKLDNNFILSDYYADLLLYDINSGNSTSIVLDRPVGMRFRKFVTKENGDIYASTTGFYGGSPDRAAYFIDGKWYDLRVIDSHFNYLGFGNNIESVGESQSGEIIWSTYGRGMYIQRGVTDFQLINRSGNRTAEFRINNVPLFVPNDPKFNDYLGYVSVESDTTFVITQDMQTDSYGNQWITNYITHTFKALICVKPESDGSLSLEHSNWLYWDMRVPYSGSLHETSMGAITIDPFDQIWIGSKYEGLARLNYNYTLDNQSDDSWRTFSVLDGLSSNQILSIGSDENGTIYVGTDNGLNMISGDNVYKLKGEYAPLGTRINGIEKDSKGNMWFATDIGLSMLESEKNTFEPDSWTHFTSENSGLLNNFCNGLHIDNDKKRILIGTELGISIYYTPFLENPDNNLSQLVIGPNPFHQNSGTLLISGIGINSGLKVLDISGNLIRIYQPEEVKSGVVHWDGKNKYGQIAATGVYVFVAANDEGKLQSGKAIVIR